MLNNKEKYSVFILNSCMSISLYIVIYMFFFGLMAINNPQLLNLSRTAAVTLFTFTLLLMAMNTIYGRLDITNKKRRSIVASAVLSVTFTDIFSYFVLQIMNVNVANNERLILFGPDFIVLIVCIILQTFWIYLLTLICNRIYYLIISPSKCLIIADTQINADHVSSKLITFKELYDIKDVLHYKYENIENCIVNSDVVFLTGIPNSFSEKYKMFCYENNKTIFIEPTIEKLILSTADKIIIDDAPFLNIPNKGLSLYQLFFKRLFDIVTSFVGIVVFLPLMAVVAIIIKINDGGRIFFKQERLTKNAKVFKIIKFRTMMENIDKIRGRSVSEQDNDDRITKPGKFLRRSRIDEIPQLFNILVGDMSVVGPRPEMISNVNEYTELIPEFKYRLKVKCGLTGLAQIDGKYNTSALDKLLMDLFYIENFSLLGDLKLMFRTLTVFFKSDTTEAFNFNNKELPRIKINYNK